VEEDTTLEEGILQGDTLQGDTLGDTTEDGNMTRNTRSTRITVDRLLPLPPPPRRGAVTVQGVSRRRSTKDSRNMVTQVGTVMVSEATTITNMARDMDQPIQSDLEVLIHHSIRPEDNILQREVIRHPEAPIPHLEDILQVNIHLQEDILVAPPILPVSTRRPTTDIVRSCIRGCDGEARRNNRLTGQLSSVC